MADYSTLATELAKPAYTGLSHADAATAITTQSETVQSLRVLSESGLFGLIQAGQLSPQSFAAVFDHPTFALFKTDIQNQNHAGVALWATGYAARELITPTEAAAITSYATTPVTVPVSPGEKIGWPVCTEHDVAHARSLN